jgi:AbrB family looped-hinge helix DNA binding protein
MSEVVRLSKKYQVVVPRKVRKKLGLDRGDELVVEARGGKVVMKPKPKNYTEYMRGLHKKVWADIEADKYVKEEREAWQT